MIKPSLIVIGCVYVFGMLAFAVIYAIGYWDAGWGYEMAIIAAFERAMLWPMELARHLR